MTFSPFGTVKEMKWDVLLNRLTHSTLQLNSRPKISENEITFLDTVLFKGERFIKKIHPRHPNSLQADGNLSISGPVYFVPPSGAKKRALRKAKPSSGTQEQIVGSKKTGMR